MNENDLNEHDLKIKEKFKNESVRKRKRDALFNGRNLPSFIQDFLIKKFTDYDGNLDEVRLREFMRKKIPKNKRQIKNLMVTHRNKHKILTRILPVSNIKDGTMRFEIPEMGIKKRETLIPRHISKEYDELTKEETWGIVEIALLEDENEKNRIELCDFKPFKPYKIRLDYYYSRRNGFDINEWIDLLIKSMEYEPNGFDSQTQKLMFLTRLLVFVEPNLNLIELAPKGTAKSYVFSNLSKYGHAISGGKVTRAKLFYDMNRNLPGSITMYDYVAMDEVQTITFSNDSEVAAALKTYLESGKFTIGNVTEKSNASLILLGNLQLTNSKKPVKDNFIEDLPAFFNESALIDRFHGFLKGWKLPRIHEDMFLDGYALNVEYFSEIMHQLRTESKFSSIVDKIIELPPKADTRDTKAIRKISSGYLKLLFPHVNSPNDIDKSKFKTYCLNPARRMRKIIKKQLSLMDDEYDPTIPDIKIK